MTPQEKATELIKKFIEPTKVPNIKGIWVEDISGAKQCALIAVEEKIETCNKFYEKLSYPANVTSDMGYVYFKKELDYLNEIKVILETDS